MLVLALLAGMARTSDAQMQRVPAVGQPAPEFTFPDANGKTVSLADFKGKKNVLVVVHRGWIGYW
ncbi:MAG: redoxin domain-containing protein [candidate division Zixibacteria bacterium]|nr:redoxin domain-containing protein [candidate division Zixibacteria bacterium]